MGLKTCISNKFQVLLMLLVHRLYSENDWFSDSFCLSSRHTLSPQIEQFM